jgi:3D (Asp-Asp-Asp) domain-containing protein
MLAELFVVTMYAIGCDVRAGHPTKSGALPQVNVTAAADPSVIPLGSTIHVAGFGERLVHDTGGKVRGKRIDLFVNDCSQARQWGRRERLVRVVKQAPVRRIGRRAAK